MFVQQAARCWSKHFKDPKVFFEYPNVIRSAHKCVERCNPEKEKKGPDSV